MRTVTVHVRAITSSFPLLVSRFLDFAAVTDNRSLGLLQHFLALRMTLFSAHSAFLSDLYRGVGAELRESDACLLEYYAHCAEARQALPGSLLLTTNSWAYIPLGTIAEPRTGAHVKAQLRPADGQACCA